MTRIPVVVATLAASLAFFGCRNTPKSVSAPIAPVSSTPPAATRNAEQVEADKKFLADVEAKKRKSRSAYLNKSDAYQHYIP